MKPLMAMLLLGCTGKDVPSDTSPQAEIRSKVLFIGIDGLRADGIASTDTPHLDTLIAQGAWSLRASTQLDARTVSGPGWTSMLTGVDANKHGIVDNGDYVNINRYYPTLIGRAHELGYSTATAIRWLPIQLNLIEPNVTNEIVLGIDAEVTAGMTEMLKSADHDVHFAALDDVDRTGHDSAFLPEEPQYQAAITVADAQVGQMLAAIEARPTRSQERWLVAITSDHGGDASGHGRLDSDNRTIPLLLWGDGVVPGQITGDFISHMDVHPTVMHYLGHPPQTHWALDGEVRAIAD